MSCKPGHILTFCGSIPPDVAAAAERSDERAGGVGPTNNYFDQSGPANDN